MTKLIRNIAALTMLAAVSACSSTNPDVKTDPAEGAVITGSTNATGSGQKSTAATLGIPPGHLPPPGLCKVWMPGEPPGQQKKKYEAGDCSYVERQVPPGGWLVYRPSKDKKEVRVSVYDSRRPEVIAIRFFDVATGAFLREESGS